MSKESKPRDRWSQLYSSSHDRPDTFCAGCGYYRVVHGAHRGDCTSREARANRENEREIPCPNV